MQKIDGNLTVYHLVQEYPELKAILVGLGFTPLDDDKMLNTVGRMMTMKRGAKHIGLSLEELNEGIRAHGYELKE